MNTKGKNEDRDQKMDGHKLFLDQSKSTCS